MYDKLLHSGLQLGDGFYTFKTPMQPQRAPGTGQFPGCFSSPERGEENGMVKSRSRSGSVSQILSAGQSRLCGHFLTRTAVRRSARPFAFTKRMRLIPGDPAGRRPFPCLSCIARGLPCLLGHPRSGELLPPLFTLARHGGEPHPGGLFSVALSVREPLGDSRLPLSRDTLPCDVRTFLYSGPETGTATTRT